MTWLLQVARAVKGNGMARKLSKVMSITLMHGTSTPAGDPPEIAAIRRVFGTELPKSVLLVSFGHSLVQQVHETIYSLLMLDNDFSALAPTSIISIRTSSQPRS